MSKFKQFIEQQGGAKKVAKRLKVTPAGVRKWLRGDGAPCIDNAALILKLAKGKLDFTTLYKETTRNV